MEVWLNLGRPRYLAEFSSADNLVTVRLTAQAAQELPLASGNNQGNQWDAAAAQSNMANELRRLGCLRDAVEHFEAALRLRPDFGPAHNDLGVTLHQLGRVPEAIAHYTAAIKINPNHADAQFNLGLALYQTGHGNEAREHVEIAVRLKPALAATWEAVQRSQAK